MSVGRSFARTILLLALALASGAQAQSYPTHSVRMLVGFPPGGGTDIMARVVGQKLSESLGQQIVVENRPGAGGNIAAEAAAKAAPDGYTLMMGHVAPIAIAPALYPKLPYDPVRDFVAITYVAWSPNVLVVYNGVPAQNVAALIALAKSRPGQLKFASSGNGTIQHLAAVSFAQAAGIDMLHVPYKGSSQAAVDLISGQVDLNFDSIPSVINFVKQGKLRALAVTTAARSAQMPEVPTLAESGLPGFDFSTWWGLFAPAGTPKEAVAKVSAETVRLLKLPDTRDKLANVGAEPGGGSPEDFAALIRGEIAKWGKVVRDGKIALE